jgi:hypothetical protein
LKSEQYPVYEGILYMKYLKEAALSTALLSLAACGGGDGDNQVTLGQSGDFQLSITDAPVDLADEVNITFDKVTVKPLDGSPKEIEDLEISSINLLDYTGGKSELLVDTTDENSDIPSLPAGEYEWMRFHISEANIVIDGQQYELEVPSGDTSGLKVNTAFSIPANDIGFFTIDFDLRHSVIGPFDAKGRNSQAGDQYYKLKPVLRLIENESVGKVTGTVDSTLLATCTATEELEELPAAVYLFEGELEEEALDDIDHEVADEDRQVTDLVEPFMSVSLSQDAGDVQFSFGFVPAGTYSIVLACGEDDADQDDDDLEYEGLQEIVVTAGEITSVTVADES